MLLSMTSEYALRAMIALAEHGFDSPIPGTQIAEKTGIPARYLSAILADLVRAGVLSATRGKRGGFRITRPATRVTLEEVLQPFERSAAGRCPFGNAVCSDVNPCLAHNGWKQVVDAQQRFFQQTTLHEVSLPIGGMKRKPKEKGQ